MNYEKCQLDPKTLFLYLGFIWNTVRWIVQLKEGKEEKIRRDAKKLFEAKHSVAREVCGFLGWTNAAIGAIPLARCRSRTVQWEFSDIIRNEEDYNIVMALSEDAKEELKFWMNIEDGIFMDITNIQYYIDSKQVENVYPLAHC